jgi:acetolactate synthase-1/3 small subunit
MTIVLESDDTTARLMEANLYKLVNVLRVQDITYVPSVMRDMALIKVRAPAPVRPQVLQVVDVFRARVIDVDPEALVVEITGTEDKIQGLVEVLEPYGILEMVRTGRVAMTRGAETIRVEPRSGATAEGKVAQGAI